MDDVGCGMEMMKVRKAEGERSDGSAGHVHHQRRRRESNVVQLFTSKCNCIKVQTLQKITLLHLETAAARICILPLVVPRHPTRFSTEYPYKGTKIEPSDIHPFVNLFCVRNFSQAARRAESCFIPFPTVIYTFLNRWESGTLDEIDESALFLEP